MAAQPSCHVSFDNESLSLFKGFNVGWFYWSIFSYFEIIFFDFVVAMRYLVHDVEAIHGLC